ncbi:MAG: hypothetical protein Q8877_03330, partial [Sweet potato little leaf phytoplasma]|nr:hypothetical protein [Sweet potato little leaf phytoplasma]
MAETAVSFVLDHVYQYLNQEGSLLKSVHKELADIKEELESIRAFLKDADKRAADEGDTKEGIKAWVKQSREVSFRIEDAIDEYIIHVVHRNNHHGCIASLQKTAFLITSLMPRHRIASKIQDIKLSIRSIKERSERYDFQTSFEEGSSRSANARGHYPRQASLYIDEDEVVGFEFP